MALTQSGYLVFGGYNMHVTGLTTCGSSAGGWGTYDTSGILSCDTDGKANTTVIINFAQSSGKSFPAAEYCYNYTTSGTAAGDWWLPSMYELSRLIENKAIVNDTLTKLGKNDFIQCGIICFRQLRILVFDRSRCLCSVVLYDNCQLV